MRCGRPAQSIFGTGSKVLRVGVNDARNADEWARGDLHDAFIMPRANQMEKPVIGCCCRQSSTLTATNAAI